MKYQTKNIVPIIILRIPYFNLNYFMNILVSKPLFSGNESKYTSRVIESTEISGTFGEFIPKFEREFAEYCGCKYGVATTSGTTALHLAVAALGIERGDEVLVSTFTNMATFFAVLYQGAKPIPIDIEEDTWNLNPALLEAKITPKQGTLRQSVRPGLVSSWLTKGAHDLTFAQWIQSDCDDIKNSSLKYDLRILFTSIFLDYKLVIRELIGKNASRI